MKQRGNDHWHGHSEITRAAVRRLFAHLAPPDGRIIGLPVERYAQLLDAGQAAMDAPLGAGIIQNYANTGLSVLYAGPGETMHSAYANPEAQKKHFMANPYAADRDHGDPRGNGYRSFLENVEYVHEQLDRAHKASSPEAELGHLGAAAHAIQDKFSGAHAWLDDSVYAGNAKAKLQVLHVFTPGHVVGLDKGRNTHHDEFDKPLADSGTKRAAVEATYQLVRAYHLNRDLDPAQADLGRRAALADYLAADDRVTIAKTPDREWAAERDRRLALERVSPDVLAGTAPREAETQLASGTPHRVSAAEIAHLRSLTSGHPAPEETAKAAGKPSVVPAADHALAVPATTAKAAHQRPSAGANHRNGLGGR